MIAGWHIDSLIKLVRHRYPDWDGFDHPPFVVDEIDYKRAAVAKARDLLGKGQFKRLLQAGDYDEIVKRLEQIGKESNLLWTAQPRNGDLAILYQPQLNRWAFVEQMRALLFDLRPSPDRLDAFVAYCQEADLPCRWPFVTYYLFLFRPHAEIFIKPRTAQWFLQFMGMAELYDSRPNADMYERYKKTCHGLMAEMSDYGARDMIDMQSLIWVAYQVSRERVGSLDLKGQIDLDKPDDPNEPSHDEMLDEMQIEDDDASAADLYEIVSSATVMAEPLPTELTWPAVSLAEVSTATGIAVDDLSAWLGAIRRKQQGIFYGPPGTGKTFMADYLARHLVGGGDGVIELVQFHPAYDYVDFVEGIRPHTDTSGQLTYRYEPGLFLKFCATAADRADSCVLIIDEINRANLSQVMGELLYALEYRDRPVTLASGRSLRIPPNVIILGTMNTADRSIALIDHALRRRFAFIALAPNHDLLRGYHQKTGFDPDALISVLEDVNRVIDDPHYALGISFFLTPDIADLLPSIWQTEIEPYLEETLFGRPQDVDRFRWSAVQSHLNWRKNSHE